MSTPKLPSRANGKLNWKPSRKPPQKRQIKSFSHIKASAPILDLTTTKTFPAVYNQGTIGSCTANALCGAFWFDGLNSDTDTKTEYQFEPSRLYLYYMERFVEGDPLIDNGAQLCDGVTCLEKYGVCSENTYPYITTDFAEVPPSACGTEAIQHTVTTASSIPQTLNDLKGCLTAGYPFVFGFVAYPELETLSSPWNLPLPNASEVSIGGHAVLCVGYDDTTQMFKIRNSWGSAWGNNGYFNMPYSYVTNVGLSNDFWMVTTVHNTVDIAPPVSATSCTCVVV
jgi:C1A family cysteine protease